MWSGVVGVRPVGGTWSPWARGAALRKKWAECKCPCWIDVALESVLRSAHSHSDKSAQTKTNKHLDGTKRLTSDTWHTQAVDLFGGSVCRLAAVAQTVSWHKARPVCECEEWAREVASEQGTVMSPARTTPPKYFGYNYPFDCGEEPYRYASTTHMIHDSTQPTGTTVQLWQPGKVVRVKKRDPLSASSP